MIQRCNYTSLKLIATPHVANNFSEIEPRPVHLSNSLVRSIGYSNSKGKDERPLTHHKLSRCSIQPSHADNQQLNQAEPKQDRQDKNAQHFFVLGPKQAALFCPASQLILAVREQVWRTHNLLRSRGPQLEKMLYEIWQDFKVLEQADIISNASTVETKRS